MASLPTKILSTRCVATFKAVNRGAPLTRTHHPYSELLASNISTKTHPLAVVISGGFSSSRSLSTSARLLSSTPSVKKQSSTASSNESSPRHGASNNQSPSPDDFKISFQDIGMNRTTRFVVYAVVGVLGTMETIFWCKALWRWWSGGEEGKAE
ncbi:hypothetical protein F5Y19DRAFT_429082 [Xylariaceae sp. FL1651]|nr:hypothetical protein F5Y19DRAFT_429082 [Xylariaceae sp. FL1651]